MRRWADDEDDMTRLGLDSTASEARPQNSSAADREIVLSRLFHHPCESRPADLHVCVSGARQPTVSAFWVCSRVVTVTQTHRMKRFFSSKGVVRLPSGNQD